MAQYDLGKQELKVCVVDQGRGIKKDEMVNLFKLFGKIERTDSENIDGIGMGLNICKKIIDHNGGTIDVFSEGENLGSTFIFTIPMTIPAAPSQTHETLLLPQV